MKRPGIRFYFRTWWERCPRFSFYPLLSCTSRRQRGFRTNVTSPGGQGARASLCSEGQKEVEAGWHVHGAVVRANVTIRTSICLTSEMSGTPWLLQLHVQYCRTHYYSCPVYCSGVFRILVTLTHETWKGVSSLSTVVLWCLRVCCYAVTVVYRRLRVWSIDLRTSSGYSLWSSHGFRLSTQVAHADNNIVVDVHGDRYFDNGER